MTRLAAVGPALATKQKQFKHKKMCAKTIDIYSYNIYQYIIYPLNC